MSSTTGLTLQQEASDKFHHDLRDAKVAELARIASRRAEIRSDAKKWEEELDRLAVQVEAATTFREVNGAGIERGDRKSMGGSIY